MFACFIYWLCPFLKVPNWSLPFIRRLFFWLKVGALQYAILKTVLSVLSVVLWTNGNFDLSDVSPVLSSFTSNFTMAINKNTNSLPAGDHKHSHLDQLFHRRPDHRLSVACGHRLHEHEQLSTQPQYYSQVCHVPGKTAEHFGNFVFRISKWNFFHVLSAEARWETEFLSHQRTAFVTLILTAIHWL